MCGMMFSEKLKKVSLEHDRTLVEAETVAPRNAIAPVGSRSGWRGELGVVPTKYKSSRKVSVRIASKTIGQFLMNFGSTDRHVSRGSEAQLDPISVNLQHHDFNIFPDKHPFAGFSAKNQHFSSSMKRETHPI